MTLVTIFTGFLGAGKTTVILNLISKLPSNYKVVLLKNEFGSATVDSQLASQGSHVQVVEIINGCLCCVLVGQLKSALLDIKKTNPDRVIIETSGSAFPAPLAWQIRELKDDGFELDSIATVIDCINFTGYEDTSYTARLQAQYTDLIILNKHDLVSEGDLDRVIDHVNDLNTDTPKILWNPDSKLEELLFGLDTGLFETNDAPYFAEHHDNEVDMIEIREDPSVIIDMAELNDFLKLIPDNVYRIKGLLPGESKRYILNWAFGRTSLSSAQDSSSELRITVLGVELQNVLPMFEEKFGSEFVVAKLVKRI